MTFALCGHVLVMCMVDHRGRVTTIEVKMEKDPLHWIQCIIAVTMGPNEVLGDDKSINAFPRLMIPSVMIHTDSLQCQRTLTAPTSWRQTAFLMLSYKSV